MTPIQTRNRTYSNPIIMPDNVNNIEANRQTPKFNFNSPEFSGNSQNVEWFLNQIKDLVKLNQFDNPAALYLLKSKLSGAALTFFQNSPPCRVVTKFEDACQLLQNFFKQEDSSSADLAKFQAISLLPSETIKNLEYRIDSLAHKAYNFINDQTALSRIKAMQFLSAIPLHLKETILIEGIQDYREMVKRANHIVTIQQSLAGSATPLVAAHAVTQCASAAPDQLTLISKQLEMLTTRIETMQSNCNICQKPHSTKLCPLLLHPVQNQDRVGHEQPRPTPNLHCVFCNRSGHIMSVCRTYLRHLRQNSFGPLAMHSFPPQFPMVSPRFTAPQYPPPPIPSQNEQFRPRVNNNTNYRGNNPLNSRRRQ
nr:uncharacterized protein LOC122272901 [Parasteatoda tepidariorum]